MIRVGVLALQGSFAEHIAVLEKINFGKQSSGDINSPLRPEIFYPNEEKITSKFANRLEIFQIRKLDDIKQDFDALILPGGESTTMGKLLRDFGIFEPLREKILSGMPTFGTCAGAILLANNISNDDRKHFGVLDVTVQRNAYGRQLGSFVACEEFKGLGKVDMVFVRAPIFENVGNDVEILSVVKNEIVAVKQGNILATSYHPELTASTLTHEFFLNFITKP